VSGSYGKGQIDFPGIFKPLLDSHWRGWLTVERESGSYPNPADHPEQLLKNCREHIREITGV
jgi:sugar phosphate isomerase/epimerase